MPKKLVDIEGIGATYAAQLTEAGVKSQEALLKAGDTPKARKDLEKMTGISGKRKRPAWAVLRSGQPLISSV